MANQMIKNMRQDELRNLSIPKSSIETTTNFNSNNNLKHNYRYQQQLNNNQSITDNLGIIYQPSEEKEEEFKIQIQYHNVRIYSQDRKWEDSTSDSFHNLKIILGSSMSNKNNQHIQIPNSFQNVITLYSPLIIIPNIFTILDEKIPNILHIKINNYTLSSTSNNAKNQLLQLKENSNNNSKTLKYTCIEKEILSLDNSVNSKLDFTSSLAINILNQYSNPLWESLQDTINIKTITFNTDTNLIDIYFTKYLFPCVWQLGDTIIIKNYSFRETELDYQECYSWNNFINKKEGHVIQNLDTNLLKDTKHIKCNKLSISTPYILNQESGELDTPEWLSNLLLKTNIDTLPNVNQEFTGNILNLNLQTVILLQFQILEKNKKI